MTKITRRPVGTRRSSAVEEEPTEQDDDFEPEEDEGVEDDENEFEDQEEEEEEEVPPTRVRRSSNGSGEGYGSGWEGREKAKKANPSGGFTPNFRSTDEEQLVIFLDDSPFDNYCQHWVERREGPRSITCIEDSAGSCPLCDAGDNPRLIAAFNILDVATGQNMRWDAGPMATAAIEKVAKSAKTGPLDVDKRGNPKYWAVSQSGKKQKVNYHITPVNEQALDEDWEQKPITDAKYQEALKGKLDASGTKRESKVELKKLVRQLVGDDDYDNDDDD